jgi:hypothetical protein
MFAFSMQEIGLAAEATIFCGLEHMPWEYLLSAYELIEEGLPREELTKHFLEPKRVTCLRSWQSTVRGGSFLDLLNTTGARATSDPRDRVFALLSHPGAKLNKTHGQEEELLMGADYNKSVEEIYRVVADRLIATSKCLDVLSYIRGCDQEGGLPTWAPLWSKRRRDIHCLLD